MNKVGIVLVNYKDYAKRFLAECRDSLRSQEYKNFKVYIVDNASSQESRDTLKDMYPEAVVIARDDGNYSAANNAGAKQALSDGADFLVIANMDTAFDEKWLSELIAALESDESIGIAQSKILVYPLEGEKAKINSLGNKLHFLGFGFTSAYMEDDRPIEGLPEIKGYASGCSLAIKKEVFGAIGGYNEDYFMYHDDVEVGWKAKLLGYKTVLAPKSICFHKFEFSRSVKKIYFMERNRFLFIFSFYELTTILAIVPALIIMEAGQLVFALLRGWLPEKLRSYAYFFSISNWRRLLAERKKIQTSRKVFDKDLIDFLEGEIYSQDIDNPILKRLANPFFKTYLSFAAKVIKG
jgi:GT2 family glycosyltransferase